MNNADLMRERLLHWAFFFFFWLYHLDQQFTAEETAVHYNFFSYQQI